MTGTVFDIGYQRYTGEREGRHRARLAVFKDGVRTALGLGRGGRAKVLPWFFFVGLSVIGVVLALVAGAAERLGGPGAAARMNLPTHADLYGVASMILFVMAAVVGPEVLCPDRRTGVISLYLVRPLTGTDYILARWASFLVVMIAAAWLPQVLLFLGLCGGDLEPVQYLKNHWQDIPKCLVAGLAMATYAATLALLVASFTTRRAYASVFLVGLFVITTPFTFGLGQQIKGPVGQWISMFNLTSIPLHVNDIIFGEPSEMTEHMPVRELAAWIRVAWFFAWTIIPGSVLVWRYRRMSP